MKKIFAFIMLLALTATTAFVFASSKKFVNQGLFVKVPGTPNTYQRISNDASLSGLALQLSSSPGNTIEIKSPGGTARSLYFNDQTGTPNYQEIESDGTW